MSIVIARSSIDVHPWLRCRAGCSRKCTDTVSAALQEVQQSDSGSWPHFKLRRLHQLLTEGMSTIGGQRGCSCSSCRWNASFLPGLADDFCSVAVHPHQACPGCCASWGSCNLLLPAALLEKRLPLAGILTRACSFCAAEGEDL